MFSEIENDYAKEKDRRREMNNENQLTKYIDRLQNESLGFTEELEFQTSKPNRHKQKIKTTKDSSTEGTLSYRNI